MYNWWILTVLNVVVCTISCTNYNRCNVKLDLSVCSSTESHNTTTGACQRGPICSKNFSIASMTQKPYNPEIVSDSLRMCCGGCIKSSVVSNISKVSHITPQLLSTSHFVFPVLAKQGARHLYGYRFLPLIETPSMYYITQKERNPVHTLIISCLNMWPLLLVCALMVVISGFVCWVAEMWVNKEEFPRSLLRGWFEGIWWSFISMTTVGYGDKTPKSVCGRVLSIIWIIVGITSFSLITATLTSEIVAANSRPPPKMKDADVGIIRHHTYEGLLVADQGGILHDVDAPDMMTGIHLLTGLLENKTINGFLLDRYELMLFYKYFQDDTTYKQDVNFLRTEAVLTEVSVKEKYVYGALVRDEEDYQFLEGFMSSNRVIIDSCTRLFLSKYSREVQVTAENASLFSPEGKIFWPSFVTCCIMIMICFAIGGVYETKRRRKFKKCVAEGEFLTT